MATGASVGFIAIWPIANAVKTENRWLLSNPLLFFGTILLGFMLAFISSVAVHEVGHVIAGKIAGFRFVFLIFWPVQIRRKGQSGLMIRPLIRSGVGLGGLAGMVPVAGLDLRKAYHQMLWGGPLASLILGLTGMAMAMLLGFGSSLVGSIFWLAGVLSLGLFLITMIPSTAGGYLSDGAAIRLLRRGSVDDSAGFVALLELSSMLGNNMRPGQLSGASLSLLLNMDEANPLYFRGQYFGFLHAADLGDLPRARLHMSTLTQNLPKIPLLMHANYRLYDALLSALEGDLDIAQTKFNKFKSGNKGLVEPGDILMVDAILDHAQGLYESAKTKALIAIRQFDESMIPESHAFAKQMLQPVLTKSPSST